MKFKLSLILAFLLINSFSLFAQKKHALTFEDMWAMKRISSYSVSPDGKQIVFAATAYDVEANKGNSDLYLINTDGTNLREFKNSEKSESSPIFSPDGNKIYYSFDGQIYSSSLDGTNEIKITDLYTGASGAVLSNDGTKLLFVSSVYPECADQKCNEEKDNEEKNKKSSGQIFTELMYRHWDDWRGDKRSHLFYKDLTSGKTFDVTLFSEFDVPPIALGSANDYSFSPDGKEIAFTMNEDSVLAISTNNDIYIVKVEDLKENEKNSFQKISTSKGNDNQPVYSPDGKYIAFCSMDRAGFEADKQRLMLYNRQTGETKNLSGDFDRSVSQIAWSPDSKTIYFDAANEIYNSVYKIDIEKPVVKMIIGENYNSSITVSKDGKRLFFKRQRSDLPYEIFSSTNSGKEIKQITSINQDILKDIEMMPTEYFWFDGANGKNVQALLIKPPFFDPNKKYPMIFLIHGGPQGHWADDFHFRWNTQLFASKGYVVVAPNPRGSVGYGQKFTDEISQDWGGKVYTDLMNAYDYAINSYKFIDSNNTFAAGASYGGYMINWIAGHNNKFNALVSHDGVFNLESMFGTTEELWFPIWENGGMPWENRENYRKWSPHLFVENFKTPMLVVQGAYDFRVPEEQAFQLFTSLQMMNVPSKLLYYPDETHFVTKPQNAKLWWNTVFNWFEKFKEK